jgi:hypothetical protein
MAIRKKMRASGYFGFVLGLSTVLSGCGQNDNVQNQGTNAPAAARGGAPASIPMGRAKSVTRFFVTSKGLGKGGDLGGLAGADAQCQALAQAQGSGDHTWRAYLSTQATGGASAVNARDRIGRGPWYNANGDIVAQNLAELHSAMSKLDKETAVTEGADSVKDDAREILTGSRADGTAFEAGMDRTCGNWTSSTAGSAEVGYVDRAGPGDNAGSWNSARATSGCSQAALQTTGGAGLFYCFAID